MRFTIAVELANPDDEGGDGYYEQQVEGAGGVEVPVEGVEHRLYVEEFVCDFGYKELADDDNCDYRAEAATHFQSEQALTGVIAAGVEHIPEVCPYED